MYNAILLEGGIMFARRLPVVCFALLLPVVLLSQVSARSHAGQGEAKKDTVLKASDITPKICPEQVFYRGQVGAVQMRNTGGIHFADDFYVLAGLVDTAGYASGVKEKYQGYFITEVPVEINGQSLKPGAYGVGFVASSKFVVSDLGGNSLLEIAGQRDAELKRATPLQMLAAPDAGAYRLYIGRDFVTLKRAR
jgi:hypothetical protein